MAAKRTAEEAGLDVGNPHDPQACRPRCGVCPCITVKDAGGYLSSFCKDTASKSFFTFEDDKKLLMHGAVVTPSYGYIFFEDIDTDCFAATRKVPFSEYRLGERPHVTLHANVPDAPLLEQKMLESKVLDDPCISVVPVGKQFWGAVHGIVKDGCGIMWSLSSKSEADMVVGPHPPPVRATILVPNADAYLKFLKEVFGEGLVEEELCRDSSGLVHAELLLMGSGLSLDRMSQHDSVAVAAYASGLKGQAGLSMEVPTGSGTAIFGALKTSGGCSAVSEMKMKFYGQVQGRLLLPSNIHMSVSEPPLKDGPTKEDIKAYIEIGEKHGWDHVCTLKPMPFKRFAGIRSPDKIPMQEVQDKGLFNKYFDAAKEAVGDSIDGPAISVYHQADTESMTFTFTAGFPVKEGFKITNPQTPAGELHLIEVHEKAKVCASTTHLGDNKELPTAWAVLSAWASARGCGRPDAAAGICGVEYHRSMSPPVTDLFMPAPDTKLPSAL